MIKDEAVLILRHMSCSLPNFNYREGDILDTWYNILKDYDYTEVFNKVNYYLEEDRFQYQAPTPQFVVRDLRKVSEKIKLNSYKVYCPICNRLFDGYDNQVNHFDRCSSVDYVIREYKKWFPKEKQPSKKELFEMTEDEFKIRYLKLLKHIYDNTQNSKEKEMIGYVIYPKNSNSKGSGNNV